MCKHLLHCHSPQSGVLPAVKFGVRWLYFKRLDELLVIWWFPHVCSGKMPLVSVSLEWPSSPQHRLKKTCFFKKKQQRFLVHLVVFSRTTSSDWCRGAGPSCKPSASGDWTRTARLSWPSVSSSQYEKGTLWPRSAWRSPTYKHSNCWEVRNKIYSNCETLLNERPKSM